MCIRDSCSPELFPLGLKMEWSASAGSIDTHGKYTAPGTAPTPNPVIVTLRVNYDGKLWILLGEVLISDAGTFKGEINHESLNPSFAFKARVDTELYLESQDLSLIHISEPTRPY